MDTAFRLIVGCGYLGERLARRWVAEGHRVAALTRRPERAAELAQLGITPFLGDVLDGSSLKFPQAEVVVYAVGLDRKSVRAYSMREVYVDGLAHVLRSLQSSGSLSPSAPLVYVSSTSVYGQTTGEEVDESSPTLPQDSSGQVVLEAEQTLRRYRPEAIVLRFAGIYGPDRLLRRVQSLHAREPIAADPEGWLNLIQVEDGVEAICRVVEQAVLVTSAGNATRAGNATSAGNAASVAQICNVCDDEPVRRRDFYNRLAELLQAPAVLFRPPASPEEGPVANRRVSNRRLRQELGVSLRYPSYRQGLPEALRSSPPSEAPLS